MPGPMQAPEKQVCLYHSILRSRIRPKKQKRSGRAGRTAFVSDGGLSGSECSPIEGPRGFVRIAQNLSCFQSF